MGQAMLQEVGIKVDFGIFELDTKWVDDPRQKEAAWALAVELQTRVATQEIGLDGGTIREALNSLYALFGITREILRSNGPKVGMRRDTVGGMAITVLNKAIRPFLSKWHPALTEWEYQKPADRSPVEHEKAWKYSVPCRAELLKMQQGLWEYSEALAKVAGASD